MSVDASFNAPKHHYLHVDLDAFFASVEQLDNPSLRGKPVIVGGKPEDRRSVVSTASYEARKYGVHSAMPVSKAYQLCPDGIFVHGRMKRYAELSYQIMNIFRDFSPDVQQLSIDEAFIDLTGTEGLFGPPEQTARKLKQRVKEETGLTVSVGLAPTKYLAKIASDMNKPDGFYKIEAGHEQEFMLNLPLKKVWGIGDKTYENLRHSGILTTRDIYEKSLDALTFMYGQNTGSFLYNVVRGIEIINFDRKTKSHSISNETTFPYDVSDVYTAETTILELCHSVMFRLLKENGFSRTVQVKIRYEDFSTVSIQQTYANSILTLDSLYNAAKELFEQKYERGRGIRLIGIALENIENTDRPRQQSLFDDGTEKKQKVEKAILGLEKKHPEIKIHKARMLQKKLTVVLVLCCLFSRTTARLQAQELVTEELQENENVQLSGWWKAGIEGSLDTTFGFGNPFGFSAKLPVFKQEVDLSALINITPSLYFSFEFLDEFRRNTYTFGYNGSGYLNELKLSNRGIVFPDIYSSAKAGYNPGGGENEAPGIMLHFTDVKNNRWEADFVLRYDMLQTKSAVFYGKNSVRETKIDLAGYVRSESFVFPTGIITGIKDVYVQNPAGEYTDKTGIKYKKLTASEYVISAVQNLLTIQDGALELEKKEGVPYILITFMNADGCDQLLAATGDYSDSSSFAGQIQAYFSQTKQGIELAQYSALDPAVMATLIEGQKAFIIQSPVSFSPYACMNSYAVKENIAQGTDFIIQNKYSQGQDISYAARYTEGTAQIYVYNLNEEPGTAGLNSKLSPAYRFPLANTYPELYLGTASSLPLELVMRTTTPVKEYDIGKYADAGSVRVYRNGILENGAVYDSGTGFVKLAYEAGELDKIYITWNQEASSLADGFVTAGAGFIYNLTPSLIFDISYAGKYPYSPPDSFATSVKPKNSYSSVVAGLTFNTGFLYLNDTITTYYEQQNVSGRLEIQAIPEQETAKSSTGTKAVLEYNSDNSTDQSIDFIISDSQKLWSACELELEITLEQDAADFFNSTTSSFDVYLELGLTEESRIEQPARWTINSLTDEAVLVPLDLTKSGKQTVKLTIADQKRPLLRTGEYARIIIHPKNTQALTVNPQEKLKLFIGEHIIIPRPLSLESSQDVTAICTPGNRKHTADIFWTDNSTLGGTITTTTYFTQEDYSVYKTINLDFALTQNAGFDFILLGAGQEKAVFAKLKPEALAPYVSPNVQYHTLTVDTQERCLKIDGNTVDKSLYELEINSGIAPCIQKIIIYTKKDTGHFYISSLYYKDCEPGLSGSNAFTLALGSDNDRYLKIYSAQGLSTASYYINANVMGGYTIAGLKFTADADTASKTAGHSLTTQKTLFDFLDFGEIYRFSDSPEKKDYIRLIAGNSTIGATLEAQSFATQNSQGYNTGLNLEFNPGSTKIQAAAGFEANQKNNWKNESENYFTLWYDISKLQFDDAKNALQRNVKFNSNLSMAFPFAELAPKFTYEIILNENTVHLHEERIAQNLTGFNLPLSFTNNAFSFNLTHKTLMKQTAGGLANQNYADSIAFLFENQKNLEWNSIALPAFALTENVISSTGSVQYELNWRRKLFNDIKDLYIPCAAGAGISREIGRTDTSFTDIYQIKANLSGNFINLFGSDSALKRISWYKQDEYRSNLSFTYRFAAEKPDSPVFLLSTTEKLLLYVQDSCTVTLADDFSIDSSLNWKFKFSASWERITAKSLIQTLSVLIWQPLSEKELKTKVEDSVTISLAYQQDKLNQSWGYMRTATMDFMKYYSLSTGAGISFGYEQDKILRLSLNYTLGLKISF